MTSNSDGQYSNKWPQWGCYNIRSSVALQQKSSWKYSDFDWSQHFRWLLRLDIKEDSCGWLGLGLVACNWCTEVSNEDILKKYLVWGACCIHYADINEIWISNQTFYWIPLKTTKFDFVSFKTFITLAIVLVKAEGRRLYLLADCIVAIFADYP